MALRPVYVTNAPGGIITQSSINAGIQAIAYVPVDTGYGDLVQLFWGAAGPLQRLYTPEGFPNYTWVVNIVTAFPPQEVLSDGVYPVYITITDSLGNVSQSAPLVITVQGSDISNPGFAAPEMQETINQAQWTAGFDITIPASPVLQPGDIYEIFVRADNTVNSVKEGIVSSSGPLTVTADPLNPALTGLNGVLGFFYYVIYRGAPLAVVGTSASRRVYIDVVPPGGV